MTSSTFIDNSGTIAIANLGGITIKGGSGANVYNVNSVRAGCLLKLDVGAGAATINVTSTGNPLTSILGPISITGTTGSTRLNADDQLDPAKNGQVLVTTQ